LGAKVTLVSGPVAQVTPVGVERIDVESAQQMHQAVLQALPGTDIFVACAAVADYRPVEVAQHKIKKEADAMQLALQRNPDILAEVAASASRPFCVGFAAETRDLAEYAERKRLAKGLDMVAANEVSASQGFDTDDNALTVFWEGGRSVLSRQPKTQLAARLMELIADRFDAQITTQTA
jgi:phosphopantothenoylcysteine decarboxylase/phosphopantothenate--cysteine ligase